MYDVALIGAGVVGGLIARELSRYQLRVVILEKGNDVALGASKANSGIVHAGFDALPGTKKARFNVEGCALMPQVARELGVAYRNNGSLVVAQNKEETASLRELYDRGLKNGVPGLELLDQAQLRERLPMVNGVAALYAPTAGIVCPYGLTIAAVGNAMDNGVELKTNFTVRSLSRTETGFTLSDGEKTVSARYVVNAAGAYADEIARMVGDTFFSIHPRAGEYVLLDKDAGALVPHTIFGAPSKLGKGILVTPTVHGNLLLGPTATDLSDKEDTQTTAAGLDQVLTGAKKLVKDLPLNQTITSFCGLRSTPDNGDFILEPSHAVERLIHVAGIESPGLSASPAIARYVVELLAGMGLPLVADPNFSPYRESMDAFSQMSMEEKNAVIARDGRYGHMVCRCEGVTEGEIVHAIHQNPPARDIDAIKRRTRSGMGRCQGGFCMPVVAEILARELSLAPEDITKSGGASHILVGKTK